MLQHLHTLTVRGGFARARQAWAGRYFWACQNAPAVSINNYSGQGIRNKSTQRSIPASLRVFPLTHIFSRLSFLRAQINIRRRITPLLIEAVWEPCQTVWGVQTGGMSKCTQFVSPGCRFPSSSACVRRDAYASICWLHKSTEERHTFRGREVQSAGLGLDASVYFWRATNLALIMSRQKNTRLELACTAASHRGLGMTGQSRFSQSKMPIREREERLQSWYLWYLDMSPSSAPPPPKKD